jgi:hypothetical protein
VPGTHDVVLSDLGMSELPGDRLAAELKARDPALALILITGWELPPGAPRREPFDFVLPFDTPFTYGGSSALVIDFAYENVQAPPGVAGGMQSDREIVNARTQSATSLGIGCPPSVHSWPYRHQMRLENSGPGCGAWAMRLRVEGIDGPPSSPTVLNIDFQDRNLNVPGLCTTVHAAPTLSLPVGDTRADGRLWAACVSFGHHPLFVGATFVTQLVTLDPGYPGIPVVLSNGAQAMMPVDPMGTAIPCVYHWQDTYPGVFGRLYFGGGAIFQLGL